jgi:protein-S-isoprenylcysteine O-methyltransferase Ste14
MMHEAIYAVLLAGGLFWYELAKPRIDEEQRKLHESEEETWEQYLKRCQSH